MSDTPLVSVLVIAWNSWPDLDRCLTSLRRSQQDGLEIVVHDNGSTDGTPEKLPAAFPEVELIYHSENIGHTKAVNIGCESARGRYVLLLDADTELEPDSIPLMFDFLEAHGDVSLVAPRTFNTDGSVQETARNFPSAWNGLFGRQSALSRIFPNNPFTKRYLIRQNLNSDEPFQVEQVGGACMMFRRSLFDEVGRWDERYFAYWVDSDWCAALKSKGKTVWCVPAAKIFHHENNASGKKKSPHRIRLFHEGAYMFYVKWYCRGPLDPRALLARGLLSLRMAMLIWLNNMKPGEAR